MCLLAGRPCRWRCAPRLLSAVGCRPGPCPDLVQCMGELMEYTDLLDKAAATEDPYER